MDPPAPGSCGRDPRLAWRRRAIVVSTHNLAEAEMAGGSHRHHPAGNLVEQGTPAELKRRVLGKA